MQPGERKEGRKLEAGDKNALHGVRSQPES